MTSIRNVIFDLGGVLVDLDIERCRAAFRALGMPEVARIIDTSHPAEMLGRLERGDSSVHEACDAMRALSGRPEVSDERIAEAYGAFLTGVPVARLRMIDELRRRGLRTYVLSNNNPMAMQVIRRMFAADGHPMEYYFDRIYLSYELRELKPSEAIFRRMIDDSGMIPGESLFIDDSERNLATARELGFGVYCPVPGEDFSHLFDADVAAFLA